MASSLGPKPSSPDLEIRYKDRTHQCESKTYINLDERANPRAVAISYLRACPERDADAVSLSIKVTGPIPKHATDIHEFSFRVIVNSEATQTTAKWLDGAPGIIEVEGPFSNMIEGTLTRCSKSSSPSPSLEDSRYSDDSGFAPPSLRSSPVIDYDQSHPSVLAFYEAYKASPQIHNLTREDHDFLRAVIIPNFLKARDILIEAHRSDPTKTFILTEKQGANCPIMNFSELTKAFGLLNSATSYFLSLAAPTSSSKERRAFMGVKIYPTGDIQYHLPEKKVGGKEKKAPIKIGSHLESPESFELFVKLSSHIPPTPEKRAAFLDEFVLAEQLIPESKQALFFNRNPETGRPSPISDLTAAKPQAKLRPRTELFELINSSLLQGVGIPLTTEELKVKLTQFFEIVTGMLSDADYINRRGFVHCDIKAENFLIERQVDSRGQEHIITIAWDFGFSKPIGFIPTNHFGTPGYIIGATKTASGKVTYEKPGRKIVRERDLFAIGKVFDNLSLMLFDRQEAPSTFRYDIATLPKEPLNLVIRKFHSQFRSFARQLYAVNIVNGTQQYTTEHLSYEQLIRHAHKMAEQLISEIDQISSFTHQSDTASWTNQVVKSAIQLQFMDEKTSLESILNTSPEASFPEKCKKLKLFFAKVDSFVGAIVDPSHVTTDKEFKLWIKQQFTQRILKSILPAIQTEITQLSRDNPEKAYAKICDFIEAFDLLLSTPDLASDQKFYSFIERARASLIQQKLHLLENSFKRFENLGIDPAQFEDFRMHLLGIMESESSRDFAAGFIIQILKPRLEAYIRQLNETIKEDLLSIPYDVLNARLSQLSNLSIEPFSRNRFGFVKHELDHFRDELEKALEAFAERLHSALLLPDYFEDFKVIAEQAILSPTKFALLQSQLSELLKEFASTSESETPSLEILNNLFRSIGTINRKIRHLESAHPATHAPTIALFQALSLELSKSKQAILDKTPTQPLESPFFSQQAPFETESVEKISSFFKSFEAKMKSHEHLIHFLASQNKFLTDLFRFSSATNLPVKHTFPSGDEVFMEEGMFIVIFEDQNKVVIKL
jgi:serine/threonine protein kinase